MRRAILIGIPVLLLGTILQTSIVSRIMLLHGNADLILLVVVAWGLQERAKAGWVWGAVASLLVGMTSGVPFYVYLIGYLSAVGVARLLVHRIWQAPLLAMFAVTLIGTFELLMLMFIQQEIINPSPAFGQVFSQIVLPTILLNMLLAIPVHAIIHDLAKRLYPDKEAA